MVELVSIIMLAAMLVFLVWRRRMGWVKITMSQSDCGTFQRGDEIEAGTGEILKIVKVNGNIITAERQSNAAKRQRWLSLAVQAAEAHWLYNQRRRDDFSPENRRLENLAVEADREYAALRQEGNDGKTHAE